MTDPFEEMIVQLEAQIRAVTALSKKKISQEGYTKLLTMVFSKDKEMRELGISLIEKLEDE